MMPQKKLSKLSLKLLSKKTCRRNRNRIRAITKLLVPLSVIISVISFCLILFIIKIISRPFIISPIALPFSGDLASDDKNIAELEKLLQDKKISYTNINRTSNSLSIKLTNSGEVIISPQKKLNTQIHSLQYMLSHLTMEGRDFTRLDLRFDKPVIVLK